MIQTIKIENLHFNQNALIEKNLKLQHIALVGYLHQFFSSGSAIYKTRGARKDKYYLITLNKILSDLPFLCIKKRRLQELIQDLETAKIIKRYSTEKHCPNIYVKLDIKAIICNP